MRAAEARQRLLLVQLELVVVRLRSGIVDDRAHHGVTHINLLLRREVSLLAPILNFIFLLFG